LRVSERVIASIRAKVRDSDENDAFLAAANLQPYFIAASDVDRVLSAMDWLERPRTEPELEETSSWLEQGVPVPPGSRDLVRRRALCGRSPRGPSWRSADRAAASGWSTPTAERDQRQRRSRGSAVGNPKVTPTDTRHMS
jgi:hypothetical protein